MEKYDKYDLFVQYAVQKGATACKIIGTDEIVFGEWVKLKCRFGCGCYGQRFTCPPFAPPLEQMQKVIKEYGYALLVLFDKPEVLGKETSKRLTKVKTAMFALERFLFLKNYYKAFAMTAGPCTICDVCVASDSLSRFKPMNIIRDFKRKRLPVINISAKETRSCRYPLIARPAMEACGIDVFATAKGAGFEKNVLQDIGENYSNVGLIMIE